MRRDKYLEINTYIHRQQKVVLPEYMPSHLLGLLLQEKKEGAHCLGLSAFSETHVAHTPSASASLSQGQRNNL